MGTGNAVRACARTYPMVGSGAMTSTARRTVRDRRHVAPRGANGGHYWNAEHEFGHEYAATALTVVVFGDAAVGVRPHLASRDLLVEIDTQRSSCGTPQTADCRSSTYIQITPFRMWCVGDAAAAPTH